MSLILTINAGSSSLKFSVYLAEPKNRPAIERNLAVTEIADGQIENLGPAARLLFKHNGSKTVSEIGTVDHAIAMSLILKTIEPILEGREVVGVGHRVVHGGVEFVEPIILNDENIERLSALIPLAPLHQPHNLASVEATREAFPKTIQVACFDTAFHRGQPWVNDVFAIPRRFYDEGVRRYGFHGLSYDYITTELKEQWPELLESKVIIAHLGNGASMCAVQNGTSRGSTMGFSPLDGLPMGTRCGQLDPGVLLYLMDKGLSPKEIGSMLYQDSGLKGLSGISSDMRTLLDSKAPEARQAIDYYVFRIRREIGAMSAVMGGLDALVFCGGIGENASEIREMVLENMDYLGLSVNRDANNSNQQNIGSGTTLALVIATDEERVIARAVAQRL